MNVSPGGFILEWLLGRSRLRRTLLGWILVIPLPSSGLVAQEPTGTVTGVVVDEGNQPLGGVLVFVDEGSPADSTSLAGVFDLDGVPPGSHLVSVRKAGWAPRSFNLELPASEARGDVGTIPLVEGPDPIATLQGNVTEAAFGQSVQGAVVELNGEIVGVADERGAFDLSEIPVAWGSNRIQVRDPATPAADTGGEFWIVNPNETWHISVVLGDPIELDPVVVEAPFNVPTRLEPFYKRRESLSGQFLTRSEIEQREARNLTTLLGDIPGMRLVHSDNRTEVHFSRHRQASGGTRLR